MTEKTLVYFHNPLKHKIARVILLVDGFLHYATNRLGPLITGRSQVYPQVRTNLRQRAIVFDVRFHERHDINLFSRSDRATIT